MIGPLVPKQKLPRLVKVEGSLLMYIVPPLGPAYIGERRTTFAKAYGIKVRCLNGEHIGNPLVPNFQGREMAVRGRL